MLFQDQDQSWLRTHISWKAYKDLVNDAVMDIALRELLNGYVPFEKRKLVREDGLEQGPTLEQVCNYSRHSVTDVYGNQMVKTCLTPEWFVNWMLLCSIDAIVPWLLFRQVSTHTGRYQQVVINCQYSVAQMCTREDTLGHYLGALIIDDVMRHNMLITHTNQTDASGVFEILLYFLILWFLIAGGHSHEPGHDGGKDWDSSNYQSRLLIIIQNSRTWPVIGSSAESPSQNVTPLHCVPKKILKIEIQKTTKMY